MRRIVGALAALLIAGCAATAVDDSVRAALAPTGKLRVGVYRGSPTSYVESGGAAHGVGYEVGRAMSERLGVPFEPVVFPGNAQLQEAARAGKVDVVLTNATDERKRFLDFSDPVLYIEKSYLIPAGSPIRVPADLDRPEIRIGVSQGSTTQAELSKVLHRPQLLPAPSLKDASRMLSEGKLDAYASNNAILFEMSDGLPGSRVLPGRWGVETFALGIPKGREAGMAWLQSFVKAARAQGLVSAAAKRAGVRGTIDPVQAK